MKITDLLASNGYVLANKAIIREVGLHESIMIGELAQEYNYWKENGRLEDGWFYSTAENIQYNTGLSVKQQRNAIGVLEQHGFIESKNMGMPRKRYFRIRENLFEQNFQTSVAKTDKQAWQKGNINNNKENSNNKNNSIYKRPTLEEVNSYISEKGLSVDGKKFFDYFEAGDWVDSQGKKVRSWKQKLLTWDNKNDSRTGSNSKGEWNRADNNSGSTTSYDRRNRNGNSDPESVRKCVEAIESAFEVEIDYSAL